MLPPPAAATWYLAAVVIIGLTSAWSARVSEGSTLQSACQWFFMGCLAFVGGITVISLWIGPSFCLASGATVSVMSLVVVCDFGNNTSAAGA